MVIVAIAHKIDIPTMEELMEDAPYGTEYFDWIRGIAETFNEFVLYPDDFITYHAHQAALRIDLDDDDGRICWDDYALMQ